MTMMDMAKRASRAVRKELAEEIQDRKDFRKAKKAIKKDAELRAYSKHADKIMEKKYELEEQKPLMKSKFDMSGTLRKSVEESK